jgi:hypothetical protein
MLRSRNGLWGLCAAIAFFASGELRAVNAQVVPGRYVLISASTGKAIDVPSFNGIPGKYLQLFTTQGGPNQRWNLTLAPGGGYFIRSAWTTGAMDVPDFNGTPGQIVQQYLPFNGGLNERWLLQYAGGNTWYIRSVWTWGVLSVPPGPQPNGTLIQQAPAVGGVNQRWYLIPAN